MIEAVLTVLFAIALSSAKDQQPTLSSNVPLCPSPPEAPLPENAVRPKYPKEALRRGNSATVDLRAVIAADGRTEGLVTIQGDPEFSRSAEEAVRRWRFKPVIKDAHPVETTYKIRVRFNPLLREANSDVELESPVPKLPPLPPFDVPVESAGQQVHRMSEFGLTSPKQLYFPEPEFSEASRKKGAGGNVNILLVVGTDGLPRDMKVICSSIPDSNQNALEAVKQWKFSPGTKDGTPVAVAIIVEVSFKTYGSP